MRTSKPLSAEGEEPPTTSGWEVEGSWSQPGAGVRTIELVFDCGEARLLTSLWMRGCSARVPQGGQLGDLKEEGGSEPVRTLLQICC